MSSTFFVFNHVGVFAWTAILLVVYVNVQLTSAIEWKFGEINGLTNITFIGGEQYEIHKYLGIPYAYPPVGERRFMKPEAMEFIESPFDATKFSPQCIQFTNITTTQFTQSEDCLYLNIYKPGRDPDMTSGHAVAI
ncbi:hypothetical protein ACF0H5_006224 [Mactra antiquata]